MGDPIDTARFNKGPLTEEQCERWLGKWLLVVIDGDYAIAHPWKSFDSDFYILDTDGCHEEPPSKVQLWYPLPEVKP